MRQQRRASKIPQAKLIHPRVLGKHFRRKLGASLRPADHEQVVVLEIAKHTRAHVHSHFRPDHFSGEQADPKRLRHLYYVLETPTGSLGELLRGHRGPELSLASHYLHRVLHIQGLH